MTDENERMRFLEREDFRLTNIEHNESESPKGIKHVANYYRDHPSDYENKIMGITHLTKKIRNALVEHTRILMELKERKQIQKEIIMYRKAGIDIIPENRIPVKQTTHITKYNKSVTVWRDSKGRFTKGEIKT